jgi:hypothetical protein
MWGQFPALRTILEAKVIPDHYYGPSSVSDNTFDRLQRILEISILVRENAAAVSEALRAGGPHREQLAADLDRLRHAHRWAATIFRDATTEIDKEVGAAEAAETRSPVRELAIRLAWYIDKYGMMSDADFAQLFSYVNWPSGSGGKATALLKLAEQIRSEAEGTGRE